MIFFHFVTTVFRFYFPISLHVWPFFSQVVFATLQSAFAMAIFLLVQNGADSGEVPDSETNSQWENLSSIFLNLVW